MSEKLRADIGQSQEPPPDDMERRTEEQEGEGTFEELLDEIDEIDDDRPFHD